MNMRIPSTPDDLKRQALSLVFEAYKTSSHEDSMNRLALYQTINNLHERNWK